MKYCRGRVRSESTWVWTPAKELCGLGMVTYLLWASASPALNWGIRVPSSQGVCAVQNRPLCSGKQALAIGIYSRLLSSSSPFSQCGFWLGFFVTKIEEATLPPYQILLAEDLLTFKPWSFSYPSPTGFRQHEIHLHNTEYSQNITHLPRNYTLKKV